MPFLLAVICTASSASLRVAPGHAEGAHVHQHQVVVGAARDQAEALLGQRGGQRLRVVDHLLLIRLERGLKRLLEGDRLGGDDVHQRAALRAGEDGLVDLGGQLARCRG